MFKTTLCDMLGIDYPILQGGMAWVATGELAAAVSEGGGLGIIGAGNAPRDVVRREIEKVKKATKKNFGVNIMLLSPFVEDIVDLVVQEQVPIVTTGAGNPGKYLSRFKEVGIKVLPVVSSVALALRLERMGADALIAEGMEAGGHIGELTTMALVPQIAQAVQIPVIAAGGIADGRGLLAAFCLGAQGIQIGTRFVCAVESLAHPNYKQKIIKAGDRDTVVTGSSTGHPVRVLKNRLSRKIEQMEKEGRLPREIEEFAAGKLAEAVCKGEVIYGSVMAGQSAGLVHKEEKAVEIIKDIIDGAFITLQKICRTTKTDSRRKDEEGEK